MVSIHSDIDAVELLRVPFDAKIYEDAVELPVVQQGVRKDVFNGKITQFTLKSGYGGCCGVVYGVSSACSAHVHAAQVLGRVCRRSQQFQLPSNRFRGLFQRHKRGMIYPLPPHAPCVTTAFVLALTDFPSPRAESRHHSWARGGGDRASHHAQDSREVELWSVTGAGPCVRRKQTQTRTDIVVFVVTQAQSTKACGGKTKTSQSHFCKC